MATSKRESLRSTFARGHDFIFEYCCGLCEEQGNVKDAVGYCSDCKAYLCTECFNTHLRPKPSRHHQLLDQQQMPKYQSPRDSGRPISTLKGGSDYLYENCCDLCDGEGQQKEAVGYCSDCKTYLCTECFNTHLRPKPLRHHTLLDQQQMPKDQTNRDTSRPISTLKYGSDFLYEECCDLCKREGQQTEAVGYCSDCREYLCTECFRNHTRPKPMRHHVLLDQHQMPTRTKTRAHHVMDVRVGSRDDRYTPFIKGCVVLPGDKLVLVDYKNDKIKLADLTRRNVVSRMKLSGEIWDITQVSSTRVAVTSPYEQTIYFVNVGDTLKLDSEVKVKGQCLGIARINDNLVVSYVKPVKVEIISMEGNVLKTVVTEDKGKQLFTDPFCIAVNKDQQTIYIADWHRHTVTSVDLEGRVKAAYKDKNKLNWPYGLTVDTTGTVYVCGYDSYNVLQLTADLAERRQLLQKSDGVEWPTSVCYCETTDILCVGMWKSDVVKVFQMK